MKFKLETQSVCGRPFRNKEGSQLIAMMLTCEKILL